jgi:hypothetical protein
MNIGRRILSLGGITSVFLPVPLKLYSVPDRDVLIFSYLFVDTAVRLIVLEDSLCELVSKVLPADRLGTGTNAIVWVDALCP